MKNRERWQPSKYVYKNGKLRASRDPKEVSVGSRLVVDLFAKCYDANLREHAKGRLLDLGCGKVPLFMAYKDFITENICVDWANSPHHNEYLDYECDLTKVLPFQDGEFNTIILSDVLEHLAQPEHLWQEMARILAARGRIIMNVPFYYWLHEQPHDYYRYTEFALRRFVADAGLKLIQLESVGGAPEIMADIFSKTIMRRPVVGRWLAMFTQWLTACFIKTKMGRRASAASREAFPFAYFMVAEKPNATVKPT